MKEVIADIFRRSLAELSSGRYPSLRIAGTGVVDDNLTLRAPLASAVIEGIDGDRQEPLALITATSPQLTPDNPSLLSLLVRRAQAHKVPYFIAWTLRDAVLWKTPKPGTPAQQGYLEKLRDYEDNYAISPDAENQIFDEQLRLRVIEHAQHFFIDLERLYNDQALELVSIDATYFVSRIIDAVHELLPKVTDSLHMRLASDLDTRRSLGEWAVKQGISGTHTDRDFSVAISRQIIYRLLGKILFYQGLRRAARQLPKLDLRGVDTAQVLPSLRRAFAEALKVDYHAVFSEDLPDTVPWPGDAAQRLVTLVNEFNTRDFSSLPQDVIGTVFERLIPPEDRHLLGQYFTSEALCDLGIAFCVHDANALVADMTCGTGTFLIRAYDCKRWLGNHDHSQLLSQLWGIDVAPFPAELAVINLFRQNLIAEGNFPRIACRDVFTIKPGDALPFPPPKMDVNHPEQINEPVPLFDAIVGNFPYKSADQIQQHDSRYLEFLLETMLDGWLELYPQLFYYPVKKDQQEFERSIAEGKHASCDRKRIKICLSAYADLYVYLFIHATRFLKPGARMGIVTSNAWLDVNYGYELQRFFCDHFKIVAILESRCEPWFTEASVNTVFTVLERCSDREARDQHLVKFVKVKKRLADLIPADPQLEAIERWRRLRRFTENVESSGRKDARTIPLGVLTDESPETRIRICRQGELRDKIEHESKTVKWGSLLRAPEVHFELLQKGRFCLLREIAMPKFGSKTRINEFFHVTGEVQDRFEIEEEYLLPLIKSPKDSQRIPIGRGELELSLFICRRSKQELKKLGHKGALKYIQWGETQKYERGEFEGLRWPEGTWVARREPGWYALPNTETNIGHVFFGQTFGERHMHRFSSTPLIPDCRLYYLEPVSKLSNKTLAALLNSSLFALACEVYGRVTLGDGVLELKVEDARDYLRVPDLRDISPESKKEIEAAFGELCKRDIMSIFQEVKCKDRQALDSAILTAIDLNPKKWLSSIYEGLCELTKERITLGEIRGKTRKTKARGVKAEKQSFQDVLDELLPDGPKIFPDDFLSVTASRDECLDVELPEAELTLDASPLTTSLYADRRIFRQVKHSAEGKFLIYSQRAGLKTARVPTKPVEVTRTVANYERYLRDLRKSLYDSYFRRTLDVSVAARLTQKAFERFRLPSVDQ